MKPLIQVKGNQITVDSYEAGRLRSAKTAETKTPLNREDLAKVKTVADLVSIVEAVIVKCERLQAEIDELRAQ